MIKLIPDPGVLPSFPPPKPGEKIKIYVEGEPPVKDRSFSIRNPKHPQYDSFIKLRKAAIKVMKGRKWYDGPVKLSFTYFAPELNKPLIDYVGGIMDTLDGSHGLTFTYLPIIFQDDNQVKQLQSAKFTEHTKIKYSLEIVFLDLSDV